MYRLIGVLALVFGLASGDAAFAQGVRGDISEQAVDEQSFIQFALGGARVRPGAPLRLTPVQKRKVALILRDARKGATQAVRLARRLQATPGRTAGALSMQRAALAVDNAALRQDFAALNDGMVFLSDQLVVQKGVGEAQQLFQIFHNLLNALRQTSNDVSRNFRG